MILDYADYRDRIPLTPYEHKTGKIDDARKNELCDLILKFLLKERGMIAAFNKPYEAKLAVLRSYMNERSPLPIPQYILDAQDELLWNETLERGIVEHKKLLTRDDRLILWHGDITRLDTDVVVNAANSEMLGCFIPGHNCLDNIMHFYAGMQVRRDCGVIMSYQGEAEPTGEVKVTRAYNLPSKYIFHTVGPMTTRTATDTDRMELRSCYISCLEQLQAMNLHSIAFCCISTGIFNFPKAEAAEIAVGTVKNWMMKHPDYDLTVVFDVYYDKDAEVYNDIFRFL